MLLDDVTVTISPKDVEIVVEEIAETNVVIETEPGIIILASGNLGPRGPEGQRGYTGAEGPVGPQGLEGPMGPTGPQGTQGPEGSPGTAVGSAHYEWKTNTDATDPAHGFIKANNVDATLYTEVYASVYTKENTVVRFDQVEVGSLFLIYELGQLDTWNRYEVTGPIVNHGNEWFTVPCVFVETGSLPFTPGGNTQVEVQTPVKGDPGPMGPEGPAGPEGPQGVQGVQGTTGSQGVKGDTGETGPQGIQGIEGSQGIKGDIGDQGLQGPQGEIGPQGVKGDKGDLGPVGPTGADSTVPGPQGPQGIKGDTGLQGPVGPASTVPGPQGPEGPQGTIGPQGPTGPVSTVPGPTGPKGDPGVQGPQGVKGDTGIGIPPGGEIGQVLAKETTTDYDTLWVDAGAGGGGSTDLEYLGEWQSGIEYSDGDVVLHNGVPYMATKTTMEAPVEWSVPGAGPAGPEGPPGPPGIQGPPGSEGPQGPQGIPGTGISVGTTPPGSPTLNQLWVDLT